MTTAVSAVWLAACVGHEPVTVVRPILDRDPVVLDEAAPAAAITIANNYPFAVREPIRFPVALEPAGDGVRYEAVADRQGAADIPLQVRVENGRSLGWLDLELEPGKTRRFTVRRARGPASPLDVGVADRFGSGLPMRFRLPDGSILPLFDLSFVEIVGQLDEFPDRREERIRSSLGSRSGSRLTFQETGRRAGPVMSEFSFSAVGGELNEYTVTVAYRVFASGIVDSDIYVRTRELREPTAYLALAKHLVGVRPRDAVIRWKGKLISIEPGGVSPPRTERAHSWGRDVSWVALAGDGPAADRALLARFTPGLTRMHDDRVRNVNDFFVNEYLVGLDDRWVLLAEIAREKSANMRSYLPGEFVVPAEDEVVHLEYRLLPPAERTAETVDQAFNSFAGYRGAHQQGDEIRLDFGVDGVSFGTSYFPHSTFAENFEFWRTGGMSGRFRPVDQWWPTFVGWECFRYEIRRDMRIANAMGLEWIRIHHFDAPDFREDHVTTPAGRWMLEYLEFMAEVARETDQRLYLDFSLSPNDVALLAERFGDVIGVWEIQNEVLIIPGASEDRYAYWLEVRNRIRAARPDAVVLLTGGPQFYALYDHLEREGVVSDAVGQHAYVDARGMAEHFRDIAVSLGGYATRTGRLPLNSEYNWRMITRDTEEQQARRFEEISEHLLSQRSVPLLLQFQFQETFAVPPRTRGALRHYELLRVDRTPKPQGLAYTSLIRRFGREDNRLRQLEVSIDEVMLQPGRGFEYTLRLRNLTDGVLDLLATPALPADFVGAAGETAIRLSPGEERVFVRRATAPADLPPGVYHLFEEIRSGGRPHFGWGIARHRTQPRLDLDAPPLPGVRYAGGIGALSDVDLSSFSHVVFGAEAPALEVDWALYLYHSLRAATGADTRRARDTDVGPEEKAGNLVLVGNAESNPLFAEIGSSFPGGLPVLAAGEGMVLPLFRAGGGGTVLLVTGGDAEGVQKAAADFLYRYWRYARAAVSFHPGMPPVDGHLPPGQPESEVTPAGAIALIGPTRISAGEAFRVLALDRSEPPRPLPRIGLSVRLDGREVAVGRTDASGEATFRLEAPGTYEIVASGAASQPLQVRVEP